uniref:hypothetical protein n=1 Tax=Chroothece richteriana TaxID=101928 RepID=UPI001FCE2B37|nr:hypothetical protein MW631_pgp086 [Chroothece richteriana]UNJ14222.1 hypothetical protein [Chroothece richteriana]
MTTYYFTLATRTFLLEEEPVEEILRERSNFYHANNLAIDFWLIPNFEPSIFPNLGLSSTLMEQNLAAIVSTNPLFIDWLKLRLQYVVNGVFEVEDISFIIQ